MKFNRNIQLEHGLKQIEITPLINVIFLLLFFFILSSVLTVEPSINVSLPKAITSDIVKEKNTVITITGENIISLNDNVLTIKELSTALSNRTDKNNAILIKTDRKASVGRIVDVWDLCRNLGIEKINIATNQDR